MPVKKKKLNNNNNLAVIILAAGQGKRMKSSLPKAMHGLAGRPLIGWLLESVAALNPARVIVVTAPGADIPVHEFYKDAKTAVQKTPRGTADAVAAALPALKGFKGDVLVLLGDMPLMSPATLRALIKARRDKKAGLSVLGAHYNPAPAFGRLVKDAAGFVAAIVEDKDCTPAQRKITLCNTGAFCVAGGNLARWLSRIGNKNAQKEYYFTDIVAVAAKEGARTALCLAQDNEELRGVNSRSDLAALESIVQKNLRARAMEGGATLTDPDTVYFSWDTKTGRDVVIEPGVVFGPSVVVGDNAHIKAYSYLEGARVSDNVSVGPFARLRPGADIGAGSKIGNFVEIKNARLGEGVKASHLAYIGDADIGAGVNFSCGAITVNYDGTHKHKTVIGARAMIGSNVSLIAPVTIGADSYIAAGSTISKDVPASALAVAREKKATIIEDWAARKTIKKKGK